MKENQEHIMNMIDMNVGYVAIIVTNGKSGNSRRKAIGV